MSAVARNGHGIEREEPLSPAMRMTEAMLMGLRLAEGVDLTRIAVLGERPVEQAVDLRAVATLTREGLVEHRGDRLRATPAGMLVLNAVIAAVVR